METTIVLAKVIGIYFLVSGIFLVTHKKTFALLLKDLFAHRALTFLIGILLVFGGGALVLTHNVWTTPLSVFVALMSWAILLKGIMYVFFPEWLYSSIKHLNRGVIACAGLTITLLGIYIVFLM